MLDSNSNRNLRIRTAVNTDSYDDNNVSVRLDQDIDNLEILSLKITHDKLYKKHVSSYGCICGRILANNGVGVPNAKISIFIEPDTEWLEDTILSELYPFTSVYSKDSDNIRYNTLPDFKDSECFTVIGTFPNKRLVLDDSNVIEVFDRFYKYTTKTNDSGDYMLFGVPTGQQRFHVDIDLSDVGYLSQKPYDLIYKGHNLNEFENASKFRSSTNLDYLPQVISDDSVVDVKPFWGDDEESSNIKITRKDVDVNYEFTPTCVFIGSIVTDSKSDGVSEKCIPTNRMGKMDRLTTGAGTIEMIRKTPEGTIESFQVNGTELIDGDGTWCYQIPMNLDRMKTDEYGNLVPSEDPTKGIPTRCSVRFRISIHDSASDTERNHVAKVLVPNNPKKYDDLDYNFGTNTTTFKDLFWNNVYSVKSYIPRFQKGNHDKNKRYSGFKTVNVDGGNNPIPYNNLRIRLTFMFTLQCAILKCLVWIAKGVNWFYGIWFMAKRAHRYMTVGDDICPDLEGWYFAPGARNDNKRRRALYSKTLSLLRGDEINGDDGKSIDSTSIDEKNSDGEQVCLTNQTKYLMNCIEMNLAMEYEVINFDFYNDWLNGMVYIPHWFARMKKRHTHFFKLNKQKNRRILYCGENGKEYSKRRLVEQCALEYAEDDEHMYSKVVSHVGCSKNMLKCHKSSGRKHRKIFSKSNTLGGGGIVHTKETIKKDTVYYFKPCEWPDNGAKRTILFATDIILLGSLDANNREGIPQAFINIPSTSYLMPSNLASTNMDGEGNMYIFARDGSSVCSNSSNEDSLEVAKQTFDAYQKWSKKKDYYEAVPDDTTEYAVTESAGIDWGYSGPNQGSDDGALFKPGGHFLGISCVNSQTTIKSCVNLKRICEVGATLSSRNYIVVKNGDDFDFTYIIPTGFISKDEITDEDFREMFATLNINNLETEIDPETNFKRYKFISVSPNNFGGELVDKINESYNVANSFADDETISKTSNDYRSNEQAIRRTFESKSNDYYRYRFGEIDKTFESGYLKKHYLVRNSNGSVSLPMYENSFYFYFGLKTGNSAIEKFLTNFYANCSEIDEDFAYFKITSEKSTYCDNNDGIINITFSDIEDPYSISCITQDGDTLYVSSSEEVDDVDVLTVSKDPFYKILYYNESGDFVSEIINEEHYNKKENNNGQSVEYSAYQKMDKYYTNFENISITGLKGTIDGYRYILTLGSNDGQEANSEITIIREYPEGYSNITLSETDFEEISQFNDGSERWAQETVKKIENFTTGITGNEKGFVTIQNYESLTNDNNDNYIFGFLISNSDEYTYFTYETVDEDSLGEIIKSVTDGKVLLEWPKDAQGKYIDTDGNVFVWNGNDYFTVYMLYKCGEEMNVIEVDSIYVSVPSDLDLYICDTDLTYSNTIGPLVTKGFCDHVNWWEKIIDEFDGITGKTYLYRTLNTDGTYTFETSNEYDKNKDFVVSMTPKKVWNIKKALFFQDSAFDEDGSDSILVGPTGGSGLYTKYLVGAGEMIYKNEDYDDSLVYKVTTISKKIYYNTDGIVIPNSDYYKKIGDSYSINNEGVILPTHNLLFGVGISNHVHFHTEKRSLSETNGLNFVFPNLSTDINMALSYGRDNSKVYHGPKNDYGIYYYDRKNNTYIPSGATIFSDAAYADTVKIMNGDGIGKKYQWANRGYFLTLPSVYSPFYFNMVIIIDNNNNISYRYRINNGLTYPNSEGKFCFSENQITINEVVYDIGTDSGRYVKNEDREIKDYDGHVYLPIDEMYRSNVDKHTLNSMPKSNLETWYPNLEGTDLMRLRTEILGGRLGVLNHSKTFGGNLNNSNYNVTDNNTFVYSITEGCPNDDIQDNVNVIELSEEIDVSFPSKDALSRTTNIIYLYAIDSSSLNIIYNLLDSYCYNDSYFDGVFTGSNDNWGYLGRFEEAMQRTADGYLQNAGYYVVGVCDMFTNNCELTSADDVGNKVLARWSMLPRHTNMFAICKIYTYQAWMEIYNVANQDEETY